MPTEWKWKSNSGSEFGPVPFSELASLVADGELDGLSLVCRTGSDEWQFAELVPGLLHAAKGLQAGTTPANQAEVDATELLLPSVPPNRDFNKPSPATRLFFFLGIPVLVGIVCFLGWQVLLVDQRFPLPSHLAASQESWQIPIWGFASTTDVLILLADLFVVLMIGKLWIGSRPSQNGEDDAR